MKLTKILYYIGLVCVVIGGLLLIASAIISRTKYAEFSDLFLSISSILGFISIAVLVIRLIINVRAVSSMRVEQPKVVVKVVDVKDIAKTKEEKLFEQYEGLYKQGLITQEDLELKRKELLGK